eukprot:TRINITY_DN1703_c5_g1_i1.p2 TRINITY_DN1703_c5_g1~~TRINITY_DN1703_c5_g1_i1.p2  ORF type:complete len:107 (+),score=16.09 TRINITY_DN1703_c5_g1_i1:190-510(+)
MASSTYALNLFQDSSRQLLCSRRTINLSTSVQPRGYQCTSNSLNMVGRSLTTRHPLPNTGRNLLAILHLHQLVRPHQLDLHQPVHLSNLSQVHPLPRQHHMAKVFK